MKKSESNAKQRNQSILRAVLLVLSVMIFTGFGVALFPLAKYWEKAAISGDCAAKKDSLDLLKSQEAQLLQYLTSLESQCDSVNQLDRIWEAAKSNSSTANDFETKINDLEKELYAFSKNLLKPDVGVLGQKSASIYEDWKTSRALIWDLRNVHKPEDPNPGPSSCEERIEQMRMQMGMKAESIADALADEIKTLEELRLKKGIFCGNNKLAQIEIQNIISHLTRLEGRLRSL